MIGERRVFWIVSNFFLFCSCGVNVEFRNLTGSPGYVRLSYAWKMVAISLAIVILYLFSAIKGHNCHYSVCMN